MPQLIANYSFRYHAAVLGCNDYKMLDNNVQVARDYMGECTYKLNRAMSLSRREGLEVPREITPESVFRWFLDFLGLLYRGSDCEVLFLATLLPNKMDSDGRGRSKNIKGEFNELLVGAVGDRDYEIKIVDRVGRSRTLSWRPIDLRGEVPADPRDSAHYCPRIRDGTHVHARYLHRFLIDVGNKIRKYNRKKSRNDRAAAAV